VFIVWDSFRKDHWFTGKEEDIEVGLDFGKRFLSTYLDRWTSRDPFCTSGPGKGDLDLYAYVHRLEGVIDDTDEQFGGHARRRALSSR
jgi:RHS repeat-associated protein